jgi:hypothetical protein
MDWMLHIDTDELVYPGGGPEYSIQRVLAAVPPDVDTMVFPNYESLPERDDVQDPFTEVGGASYMPGNLACDPLCPVCAIMRSLGASLKEHLLGLLLYSTANYS